MDTVVKLTDAAAIRDLDRLETRVAAGLKGSFDAGAALKEIRDDKRRLYRLKGDGKFQTFEVYCRGVWQMSPRHTLRLIDSYDTFVAISESGPIGPVSQVVMNEGALRPLARLSVLTDRVAAFEAAVSIARDEGKSVTGRHVALAVLDRVTAASAQSEFSPVVKPTDNWNFSPVRYGRLDGEDGHGYIPGDLYANCLWYWSKPGHVVAAPMAGAGQIMRVYQRRDEWAIPAPWDLDLRMFDLNPRGPYVTMIRQNDLTISLPVERADYVIMDVPYFGMVEGQYSKKAEDLANMGAEAWAGAISAIARSCRRVQKVGGLCTVICPNFRQIKTGEVVLTTAVVREAFLSAGYVLHDLAYASRRIQQDQSPGMGIKNNMAKRNRTMLTDISEVQTFRIP